MEKTVKKDSHISDHKKFVGRVYREYLGREPDDVGLVHYLKMIENGVSRMQIISDISNSSESKDRNQVIKSNVVLKKYNRFRKIRNIPIIGRVFFACVFLWNLEAFLREIRVLSNKLENNNE